MSTQKLLVHHSYIDYRVTLNSHIIIIWALNGLINNSWTSILGGLRHRRPVEEERAMW